LISFAANPTDIKNFTTASDGSTQAPVRDWFRVDGADLCIGVDIQSLGYPNGTDGTNATIAVQYSGGDGDLFQVRAFNLWLFLEPKLIAV
jgi:hypothetical protein